MKCSTHPRYKAAQKPRRSRDYPDGCVNCWQVYADKQQKVVADLFKAAKTGGAVLRAAIMQHGGPTVGMYDVSVSNVVVAAVNWRHGPNMQNRKFTTELEQDLVSAVDEMTKVEDNDS